MAGAGGGVALVGVANIIPPEMTTLKAVLTYIAPVAGILLSIAWAYVFLELKAWVYRRRLRNSLVVLREIRDRGDARASPEHKTNVQRKIEQLEMLFLELEAADSEALIEMLNGVPITLPALAPDEPPRGSITANGQIQGQTAENRI
jgi:hypothetical protein